MSIIVRRRRKTPLEKRIDSLVGPVYGVKTPTGCPRNYKNATYAARCNRFGRVFLAAHKPPIDAYAAGPNLKVSATLDTPKTLLYLDFDTHKRGTSEDVAALFARLRQYIPGLLPAVIDARGGANWLVIDTREWIGPHTCRTAIEDTEYNALLGEFQAKLQNLRADLDIEHIEVKGRVYERDERFNHAIGSAEVAGVKAGDLLKCPPAEEYVAQRPVTVAELGKIVDALPSTPAVAAPTPAKADRKQRVGGGSFRARLLSDEQLAEVDRLADAVEGRFKDRPTHAGRHRIDARRFAEILLALTVLTPNDDGSNPCARHAEFLDSVPEFRHRHRHEVYKTVRDYLSRCDLIEWADSTYSFVGGGPGQACKWRLKDEVVRWVLGILNGDTDNTTTLVTTSVCLTDGKKPVRINGGGILVFDPKKVADEDRRRRLRWAEEWAEVHCYAHAA